MNFYRFFVAWRLINTSEDPSIVSDAHNFHYCFEQSIDSLDSSSYRSLSRLDCLNISPPESVYVCPIGTLINSISFPSTKLSKQIEIEFHLNKIQTKQKSLDDFSFNSLSINQTLHYQIFIL